METSNESVTISSWADEEAVSTTLLPVIASTIYTTLLVIGVVGNAMTVATIVLNRSMHCSTNFYLLSLAASDLSLLLFGIPKEIYDLWRRNRYELGDVICVLQGFAAETSANSTVLIVLVFTVERYVAICHPFVAHAATTSNCRALKHIAYVWITAFCLAIPQAYQFGVTYSEDGVGRQCTLRRELVPYSWEMSSVIFFVAPSCLISALYVRIACRLRSSALFKRSSSGSLRPMDGNSRKAHTNVVRMLVSVVVAFIVCWAPFHLQRLVAMYGRSSKPSPTLVSFYKALTHLSGVLYYMSATLNPLLYHIMSRRFRVAFQNTFGACLGCKGDKKLRRCGAILAHTRPNTMLRRSTNASNTSAASFVTNIRGREEDMLLRSTTRNSSIVSTTRNSSIGSATRHGSIASTTRNSSIGSATRHGNDVVYKP